MDEVIVRGTLFRAEVINGQRVLVQVLPEARPDPWNRTSTDHVRGKGVRNRYHRCGGIPTVRNGWRLTTKDE